ncbi:acetyl-CoA carboxylase biotin carboxyl carrier protein [Bacillus manliponensis]|uniref:acetyl-CoA carboxylase biotin carboxyl carrier protein n=1 Tax=Bacillus manliponensis TaxID=574376 RepID=UPI003518DB5C
MLKSDELLKLVERIDGTTIDEVYYEKDGFIVRVKNQNLESQGQPIQKNIEIESIQIHEKVTDHDSKEITVVSEKKELGDVTDTIHKVVSPMVGTFYSSSAPDKPPFVKVGDHVTADANLCVIEAMKLFNDVQAEVNGEIVEVLVNDGELVEYGQPLFLIKTE